jgi:hypothetical protein
MRILSPQFFSVDQGEESGAHASQTGTAGLRIPHGAVSEVSDGATPYVLRNPTRDSSCKGMHDGFSFFHRAKQPDAWKTLDKVFVAFWTRPRTSAAAREVADGYLPLRSGLTEGAGWQVCRRVAGLGWMHGQVTQTERADGNLRMNGRQGTNTSR